MGKFYTLNEAADKLGLEPQILYQLCQIGKMKGAYLLKETGKWVIPEESFVTTREQDEKAKDVLNKIDRKNREAGEVDEFNLI